MERLGVPRARVRARSASGMAMIGETRSGRWVRGCGIVAGVGGRSISGPTGRGLTVRAPGAGDRSPSCRVRALSRRRERPRVRGRSGGAARASRPIGSRSCARRRCAHCGDRSLGGARGHQPAHDALPSTRPLPGRRSAKTDASRIGRRCSQPPSGGCELARRGSCRRPSNRSAGGH